MPFGLSERIWRDLECLGGGKGLPSVLGALSGSSGGTLGIKVPALEQLDIADDYPQTVSNAVTPPSSGTVLLAFELASIISGAPWFDWGSGSGRGLNARAVTTTTPDRLRGGCGGVGILDCSVGAQDPIGGLNRRYGSLDWTEGGSFRVAIYDGVGGVETEVTVGGVGSFAASTTPVSMFLGNARGKVCWAVLSERVAPAAIAAQMTTLDAPHVIAEARGTAWYYPTYAVGDGDELTDASQIVGNGSAAASVGAWSLVSGTARLRGAS